MPALNIVPLTHLWHVHYTAYDEEIMVSGYAAAVFLKSRKIKKVGASPHSTS